MIDSVALCVLWQAGDDGNQLPVSELAAVIPRIYLVDRREHAEALTAFPDPRVHYAPFRKSVSLGTALNRALALAYEEQKAWLWVIDANTVIGPDQLIGWSRKASASIALYQAETANRPPSFWQRPLSGHLLAVTAARAVGGWNPNLPSQLVFSDFIQRLEKSGYVSQVGAQVVYSPRLQNFDLISVLRSLVILMQRQLQRK